MPATIADEMLVQAYLCTQEQDMRTAMKGIVEVCHETGDRHFARVARLAEGYGEGIVTPARRHISSGRVEGTNYMIQTLRRAG
ncbi:MAG: transposase [Coriobacteriaceae bacterium]